MRSTAKVNEDLDCICETLKTLVLVSGTNIKTINGSSILAAGNLNLVDMSTNQASIGGNKGFTGSITINPVITASAGIGTNTLISGTINAAAVNDKLYALDINANFVTNGFAGVAGYAIRHNSDIIPRTTNNVNIGGASLIYNNAYARTLDSGVNDLSLKANSIIGAVLKQSGRMIVQNGGTFTDDGVNQLQVGGSIKAVLGTFADNTAAAALSTNSFYKTATGEVRIKV